MGYLIRDKLLLKGSPQMRRAVARDKFFPGDIIARCSSVELSKHDTKLIKKTRLGPRLFDTSGQRAVFAVGYATLCLAVMLKRKERNARAFFDSETGVLEIHCAKPISKGELVLCHRQTEIVCGEITEPVGDGKFEVRKSPGKGKGIFALRDFKPGDRMGEYPVILAPGGAWSDAGLIKKTILNRYYLDWGWEHLAFSLGLWLLHNTTDDGTVRTTNATYDADYKLRIIRNRCLRHIKEGDEVTIPYICVTEPIEKLKQYF